MRIGILAVQGAFEEHRSVLQSLGADTILLRQKSDIGTLDGLILPGGESTVQGKLLKDLHMLDPLKEMINNGLPVLATCAGLILLADKISNDENTWFGTLPVLVKRNAYGRQLGSFYYKGDVGDISDFNMTFIRAPYIESVSNNVDVIATAYDHIVGVRYKNQIGLAFHPELAEDNRIHQYFLDAINSYLFT
ncbi:MAG: pyridoxal 5'-phosphate synthase glutaminase subunit PdxT [Lachnospiraceae bacterium]|jgi:5'-phosphate synthase pdxT subunit|nr:pyridoxal 5'-phosphate synthase glutaminase subunit PdxT [Lachnospiraceae bacterium]